jgi:hypothetical protein
MEFMLGYNFPLRSFVQGFVDVCGAVQKCLNPYITQYLVCGKSQLKDYVFNQQQFFWCDDVNPGMRGWVVNALKYTGRV